MHPGDKGPCVINIYSAYLYIDNLKYVYICVNKGSIVCAKNIEPYSSQYD